MLANVRPSLALPFGTRALVPVPLVLVAVATTACALPPEPPLVVLMKLALILFFLSSAEALFPLVILTVRGGLRDASISTLRTGTVAVAVVVGISTGVSAVGSGGAGGSGGAVATTVASGKGGGTGTAFEPGGHGASGLDVLLADVVVGFDIADGGNRFFSLDDSRDALRDLRVFVECRDVAAEHDRAREREECFGLWELTVRPGLPSLLCG